MSALSNMFRPKSRHISTRRVACSAWVSPQAAKKAPLPPKVAVPRLSAGSRNGRDIDSPLGFLQPGFIRRGFVQAVAGTTFGLPDLDRVTTRSDATRQNAAATSKAGDWSQILSACSRPRRRRPAANVASQIDHKISGIFIGRSMPAPFRKFR